MHDEAAVHYIDMIDQTTLGHQFIKQEFNQTPRIGWQIDPFGHSAVQAYLLGAEVLLLLFSVLSYLIFSISAHYLQEKRFSIGMERILKIITQMKS